MNTYVFRVDNRRILYLVMLLALLFAPLSGLFIEGSKIIQELTFRNPAYQAQLAPENLDYQTLQQAMDQAVYQFTWSDVSGGYSAPNPSQDFVVQIQNQGVVVADPIAKSWQWNLQLAAWGYVGSEKAVSIPAAELGKSFDQIEYRYGELTEWYRNSADGLEHGFEITSPPQASFAGLPLVLKMNYQGTYIPQTMQENKGIQFLDNNGKLHLVYDQLKVFDASGKYLPAELYLGTQLQDGVYEIFISIDDSQANYPLSVDPYLTNFSEELLASDGGVGDEFGFAVDVSGDVAIVGAPGDTTQDPNNPTIFNDAAYVFYRNSGGANQWQQVRKLEPAASAPEQQLFGWSVDIEGDIAVVGAPWYGNNGNQNQGAVYVFRRNQGGANNWGEVKVITASDAGGGDQFGRAVALDGENLVVGAPFWDFDDTLENRNFGAVYVFKRDAGGADQWNEVAKLLHQDANQDDKFGYSLDISGDYILVGAPYKPSGGGNPNQNRGAVYLFQANTSADGWDNGRMITPSDGSSGDNFGWSVSIDGDRFAVGSPQKDNVEFAKDQSGAVYIYERNRGGLNSWGESNILVPVVVLQAQQFGYSIDLHGDSLAVGSITAEDSGAVYLLERNQEGANQWGQVTKLDIPIGGTLFDFYGQSVALDGSNLLVGANGVNVGGNAKQGAAYTYYRTGSTWQLVAEPVANDIANGDKFGCDVATSSEFLVVGACEENNTQGAAYVFARNTGGADEFGQVRKISASDGASGDFFGTSVSIEKDKILVGSPGDNSNRGAAYIFYRNRGGANNWGEFAKLTANDAAASHKFGTDVSLENWHAAIGAPGSNSGQGAVYVFSRSMSGTQTWSQTRKQTVAGAGALGSAVSLDANRLLAGAPGTNNGRGTAYMFYRNQGGVDNWGLNKTFSLNNPVNGDSFGSAVTLDLDRAAIGSPGRSGGAGQVNVYYMNQGGSENWGFISSKSPAQANGAFGASVGLDSDFLAVGAPGQDEVFTYRQNNNGADGWGLFQRITGLENGARFGAAISLADDLLAVGAPLTDPGDRGRSFMYLLTELYRDLAVTKTADPAVVGPGSEITFEIRFSNQGEGEATGVVITDTFPAVLTNLRYSYSGVTAQPAGNGVWNVNQLTPGQSGTITVTATIAGTASDGDYINEVDIIGAEPEIYYDNNQASVTFEVDGTPPPVPIQLAPADGSTVPNARLRIEWRVSSGAAGYLLHFRPLGGSWSTINVTSNFYEFDFVSSGEYQWQVAAYDQVGNTSAYSSIWDVTIQHNIRLKLFLPLSSK